MVMVSLSEPAMPAPVAPWSSLPRITVLEPE
jgi:hypothetical protein